MSSPPPKLLFIALVLGACGGAVDGRAPPKDGTEAHDGDTGDTAQPAPDCAAGLLWDRDRCVPEACGLGDFGGLEGDIYVLGSAPEGGDGTVAAPLQSIGAALEMGENVVVGAGSYGEHVVVGSGTASLRGRCAALVSLSGEALDSGVDGMIRVDTSGSAVVSGFTLHDSPFVGLRVDRGSASLSDLLLSNNEAFGLLIEGGRTSVVASALDVSGTWADRGTAPGVYVGSGGSLACSACAVTTSRGVGIYLTDSELTLTDSSVSATASTAGQDAGIWAQDAASLTVLRAVIDGNSDQGVLAYGLGTEADIRETWISGTQSDAASKTGVGIMVVSGATADLQDLDFVANQKGGIGVGEDAWVNVADVRVRDQEVVPFGSVGLGVNGGVLLAEDVEISQSSSNGVVVEDGEAHLSNVRIFDLRDRDALSMGSAVVAMPGGHVVLRDFEIDDVGGVGLVAVGGALAAEDGHVIGSAMGGYAKLGGQLTLADLTISGSTFYGLVGHDAGTRVDVRDAVVGRALSPGVQVHSGAALTMSDSVVSGVQKLGVVATYDGSAKLSRVELSDVGVDEDSRQGIGLASQAGGVVVASHVDVHGVSGIGLHVAGDAASLRCERCSVNDNEFAGAGLAEGGALTLMSSSLDRNDPAGRWGGFGVFADARLGAGWLTLNGVEIGPHAVAGVWMVGEGTVDIRASRVLGGVGVNPSGALMLHGDGVFARANSPGSVTLSMDDVEISDATGAGVFLHGLSTDLAGVRFSDNALDLWVQGCDGLDDIASTGDPDREERCPQYEQVMLEYDADPYYSVPVVTDE